MTGSTREVPLSQGLVALVDEADFAKVMAAGSWHAHFDGWTYYARRNVWRDGKCHTVRMHNFITGWSYVDHVNGDGLDNRRANLRQATRGQNMANRRTPRTNRSGFKGVAKHRSGRWQARIWHERRMRSLGLFATPEDAARAYDAAAKELFGEFARPNFPEEKAS